MDTTSLALLLIGVPNLVIGAFIGALAADFWHYFKDERR